MNRREAIAALVSLPEVARIATVPANSDDVIVVECDGLLSQEGAANVKAQIQRIWPDRKVVVLSGELRIKVAPK